MKKFFFLMFFIGTFISLAGIAQAKKIELTDGSIVDGEIESFSGGKYTVKSSSLGTLQIEDSKVRAISAVQTAGASGKDNDSFDPATVQSEMQKLQPAIANDPEALKSVAGMISDPDFQALLADPEVMNAAKTLNIKALMANEKFVNAINKPSVKEINQKIKKPSAE